MAAIPWSYPSPPLRPTSGTATQRALAGTRPALRVDGDSLRRARWIAGEIERTAATDSGRVNLRQRVRALRRLRPPHLPDVEPSRRCFTRATGTMSKASAPLGIHATYTPRHGRVTARSHVDGCRRTGPDSGSDHVRPAHRIGRARSGRPTSSTAATIQDRVQAPSSSAGRSYLDLNVRPDPQDSLVADPGFCKTPRP